MCFSNHILLWLSFLYLFNIVKSFELLMCLPFHWHKSLGLSSVVDWSISVTALSPSFKSDTLSMQLYKLQAEYMFILFHEDSNPTIMEKTLEALVESCSCLTQTLRVELFNRCIFWKTTNSFTYSSSKSSNLGSHKSKLPSISFWLMHLNCLFISICLCKHTWSEVRLSEKKFIHTRLVRDLFAYLCR